MDFYKAFTSEVIKNRKQADNDFDTFFREASPDNWNDEEFFRLSMNKELANMFDQEHAKTVQQSLKTTIDFFT